MAEKREEAIRYLVNQMGFKYTLIGWAVWFSGIIYAAVLVLIQIFNNPGSNSSPESTRFVTLLAGVFFILSLPMPFISKWSLGFLMRRECKGVGCVRVTVSGLLMATMQPAWQRRMENSFREAYFDDMDLWKKHQAYFRAALVAAAIAEAPAIYGLNVALIQMFSNGGLLENTFILGACVVMLVIAQVSKYRVMPNGKRLEQFLRGGESPDEGQSDIAPPLEQM